MSAITTSGAVALKDARRFHVLLSFQNTTVEDQAAADFSGWDMTGSTAECCVTGILSEVKAVFLCSTKLTGSLWVPLLARSERHTVFYDDQTVFPEGFTIPAAWTRLAGGSPRTVVASAEDLTDVRFRARLDVLREEKERDVHDTNVRDGLTVLAGASGVVAAVSLGFLMLNVS